MAILRDVVAAAFVVGILLAGIWIYAGQPLSQAPVVSVESGSMMHGPHRGGKAGLATPWDNPSFGRAGTIDPGDIVFVKDIDEADDVEPAFGYGDRDGYGGHGDVIVFKPNGSSRSTRVIHRAMLYVETNVENCTPRVDCVFRIPAACDPGFAVFTGGVDASKYCGGSPDLITLELNRDGLFASLRDYPCWDSAQCPKFFSSFLTKGDNNEAVDQDPRVARISEPVRVDWIIGKARGEVPWFGLIKLALYGNPSYQGGVSDPTRGANWTFLKATAPWDIWLSLFLALAVLISIPMLLDLLGNVRARRRGDGQGGMKPKEPPSGPKGPG